MVGNRIQELANPNQSRLPDLPRYLSILLATMGAQIYGTEGSSLPFRSRKLPFCGELLQGMICD